MNIVYLEKAKARVDNVPVLINLVSRRVRQLNSGQRPLVKPDSPNMDRMDIALKEIAESKLEVELPPILKEEASGASAFKSLFND